MTQPPVDEQCPGCQQLAHAIIGGAQAFCGNPECHVFMWDATKPLDELAANSTFIELPDWMSQ